jgi:hypothetical protein
MAICWWRFIWKSDGKSYLARLFIAQKRCTRQKRNSHKWRRTISKSLSRRFVFYSGAYKLKIAQHFIREFRGEIDDENFMSSTLCIHFIPSLRQPHPSTLKQHC